MSFFRLCSRIYPPESIEKAVLDYASICSVKITDRSATECVIELDDRVGSLSKGQQIANEFLNYLLDISLEHHLGRNTLQT